MPAELVNSWMADETLVDGSLWPHRRLEMWLQLRTLNGIDLPSILRGSAHAYVVVQTLMYEREWEALEPLVSPSCLRAMQELTLTLTLTLTQAQTRTRTRTRSLTLSRTPTGRCRRRWSTWARWRSACSSTQA